MADRRSIAVGMAALALLVAACGSAEDAAPVLTTRAAITSTTTPTAPATTTTTTPASTTVTSTATTTTTVPTSGATDPPEWLGTRVLAIDEDGTVSPVPTPPELEDRRLRTQDLLPPPTGGFAATIDAVPGDVLARSTWHEGCPVALDDLRYVTVSFWGFDDQPHTGELVVNARYADDLAGVFAQLYEARFPVEEMRVVRSDELDAPPTGDGNNTTSFVCRQTTGGTSWSQHAYGLAIDVNPFHNPYLRDGRVLPELATAYLDRGNARPGMIFDDDAVFAAFASIGWGWGGDFRSLVDYMHFSADDR